MFSKLLLVLGVAFGYGSNLTLKTSQMVYNQAYVYDDTNNENFYYFTDFFPIFNSYWQFDNLCIDVSVDDLSEFPDITLDYIYFGNFANDYDVYGVFIYINGSIYGTYRDDFISAPKTEEFPFSKPEENFIFDSSELLLLGFPIDCYFSIAFNTFIPINERSVVMESFESNIAFTNELGIANYYADLQTVAYNDGYDNGYNDGYSDGGLYGFTDGYYEGLEDGYQIGFSDAEYVGDGTWLGNLVFGTIGGIVGFLFALSDFEVLGVSIMSIITLFVAIGIVKLLFKVLR